jgi:hypothetical protein
MIGRRHAVAFLTAAVTRSRKSSRRPRIPAGDRKLFSEAVVAAPSIDPGSSKLFFRPIIISDPCRWGQECGSFAR